MELLAIKEVIAAALISFQPDSARKLLLCSIDNVLHVYK
jgi:hypothetical protein